jgi:AcrR family transcriptional regulator
MTRSESQDLSLTKGPVPMATRTEQRARTRQAILDAVARLIDTGRTDLDVDEVAREAGVSRATFYRYFNSPLDVLFHVVADRDLLPVEAVRAAGDVPERVAMAEDVVNTWLFAVPEATRAFERSMLERNATGAAQPEDRPGRRLRYIDAALEPLADRLTERQQFLVRHALALTMGSTSVVAMLDTCGLDAVDAREVTAFAAQAIAAEALRLAAERPVDASTPA